MAFSIAGDHIHFVVTVDRRRAGLFARAVEAAITLVFKHFPGFRPCDIRPVLDSGHARNAVGYCLEQHAKHGVRGDPMLESSCVLDLMMIRLVDTGMPARVRDWLPSLSSSELAGALGGYPVRGTNPSRLPEAFELVTAGARLRSNEPLACRARAAAVRVASDLGLRNAAITALLGVGRTAIAKARRGRDPVADRAIALALGLVERHPALRGSDVIQLPARVALVRTPEGRLRTEPDELAG